MFYYHIETMEQDIERQQTNLDILKEELNYQKEQQEELQRQRDCEAQKNAISLKYNE